MRETFCLLSAFPQPTAAQSPTGRACFCTFTTPERAEIWATDFCVLSPYCSTQPQLGRAHFTGSYSFHLSNPTQFSLWEFQGFLWMYKSACFSESSCMCLLPFLPALANHCWISVSESVCKILLSFSSTWKIQDSYHEGREAVSWQFLHVFLV